MNKRQIVAIGIAFSVMIFVALILAIIVKQSWPGAHLASNFCIWLAVGLITVTQFNKLPKPPKAGYLDLRGGFYFVWLIAIWPSLLLKKSS